MVLGNVPKLHGLAGILAFIVALPLGCGDEFEGCEASRTCPPKGGEGGSDTGGTTGLGGESGDGSDTGGSAGSRGGASGSAGSSGTAGTAGTAGTDATGGSGGSGEDTEPPTIVSFTPEDGDSDIERDITVTAELSEAIDETTVTSASVTLEGPDGEVSGTLSVEDNVISFAPDKPLNLLGIYTFTLSQTVADLAGNTLGESGSAVFQARDGRWSEPSLPFGKTVSRRVKAFNRNVRGDVALGIYGWPDNSFIYGAVHTSEENHWTPAMELVTMSSTFKAMDSVAIDTLGRAVMTWYVGDEYRWSRFTSEEIWLDSGPVGKFAAVNVTSGGLATAGWLRSSDSTFVTRTQDLGDGSIGPELATPFSDYATLVASLERMALFNLAYVTDHFELSVSWKQASSWTSAQPVVSAPDMAFPLFDSDEQGNIIVVWREGDQIWSRFYDRAEDDWTQEMFVATTTPNGIVTAVDITAGNAIVSFKSLEPDRATWAAIYQEGVGWLQDSVVRLESVFIDGIAAVVMDHSGNAMATWRSNFRFRRYLRGQGWLPAGALPASTGANLDEYSMWGAGMPDGAAVFVSNQIESATDQAPWVIRFE